MSKIKISEIIGKLKKVDESDIPPYSFCLDCLNYPSDDCYWNDHYIIWRTADCCELHTAIEVIEWLRDKGYLKDELI